MSARILIVEDNLLVQELIKTALETRGYDVDVTNNGFAAVQLLNERNYELVLVEYQLPEIDGYATARMMRNLTDAKGPKLYALTASVEALKQRTGVIEIFDGIIAKPFDLHGLLRTIDKAICVPQHSQLMEAALRLWRDLGLERQPVADVVPKPSRAQANVLKPWFDIASKSTADMILLTDNSATAWLSEARAQGEAFLLPVIELKGIRSGFADATFDVHSKESWANIVATMKRFENKRAQLLDSARYARDLDTRLLTSVFLSGRALEPTVDPFRPICVEYRGFSPETEIVAAAERLAQRGLLSRKFVDRFHCCSACNSNRLNVREECPRCRSANLQQVELVHHFRCAHQAPEFHFRSGSQLICPKCGQQLRHYGGDYDKPGSVLVCNNCYVLNSGPAIGFACLDCGSHMDGDAAERHDVFSYALTTRAESFLTRSRPIALENVPSVDAIPKPVAEAIDKMLSDSFETLAGVAIIEVQYGARSSIFDLDGGTAFAGLRRLFIENMTNVLAEYAHIVTYDSADYIIISANDEVTNGAFVQNLFSHCQANLSRDLDPSYRIIDISDTKVAA
jgi:CheY-like chemotaxis protein